MSLTKALQDKDMDLLKKTVNQARTVYKAAEPTDVPEVETVHGCLPITAIFDKKSKWQIVQAVYADIIRTAAVIPEELDRNIEIAKLIATNPVLFYITQDSCPNGLL